MAETMPISFNNAPIMVGSILREACNKLKGFKGVYISAALTLLMANVIISIFLRLIIPQDAVIVAACARGASNIVIFPLITGLVMMSIYRAVDRQVVYKQVFAYYPMIVPITVVYALISIITIAYLMLIFLLFFKLSSIAIVVALVIFFFFLSIFFIFAAPLVVEKKLNAWQAIKTSCSAAWTQYKRIFAIRLIGYGAYLLGFVPLIIGGLLMGLNMVFVFVGLASSVAALVWIGPFVGVLNGIVYRQVIGVSS